MCSHCKKKVKYPAIIKYRVRVNSWYNGEGTTYHISRRSVIKKKSDSAENDMCQSDTNARTGKDV